MISTVFGIFLMVGICLCVTRETIDAVGCTDGVFTTLSHWRDLNLEHLHCSLPNLDCWNLSA